MAEGNLKIRLSDGKEAGQTLNELRQQANRLTKEINNLKPGTEEFVAKSKDLKQVGDRLKDVRSEIQNVEASNSKLTEQFSQYVPFAGQLKSVSQGFNAITTSLKGTRAALIATGVGAFIVVLGSLISYLTTTQEGIDKVTAVTRPLAAVFQMLKGVVQELGGSVFNGLAMILNGDIREGLKTIGNGFKDAVAGTKDAITEGIAAGTELDRLQKQIEQTEINLTTSRAELNAKYQESKEIAQDITRSEKERIAAARAAQDAQNQLLDEEQAFLDLKIEKMKLEQTLNDTSREDYLELAKLEAERTQFEADAAKKRASAKALENSINKQIAAEQKKERDAEDKAEAERQKKLEQERLAAIEREKAARRSIQDLQIELMDEGIEREVEKIWLDTERKIEALNGTEAQITEQTRMLEELRAKQIAGIRDKYRSEEDKKRQAELEKEKQRQKEAQQTAMAVAMGTTNALGGIFGNLASLQEEGSKSYQDFAKAQAYMSAIQGAQNAYTSTAAIPVVGPALAPFAAGVALAAGIKSAEQIGKQNIGTPAGGAGSVGGAIPVTAGPSRGVSIGAGTSAGPATGAAGSPPPTGALPNAQTNPADNTERILQAFETRISNIQVVNNLQEVNAGLSTLQNLQNDASL